MHYIYPGEETVTVVSLFCAAYFFELTCWLKQTVKVVLKLSCSFVTSQGAAGKGSAGHARALEPGDLPQPVLGQLSAGVGHAGRPGVAVVPAQPPGDPGGGGAQQAGAGHPVQSQQQDHRLLRLGLQGQGHRHRLRHGGLQQM